MQIQIEMKETLSLTSLKFWHPPGCCCVTLLTRRQTRGGVKKRRCRHPEIKTQLSCHSTRRKMISSAIRHFNWWVRVLKMVVTAAGWWDEDNERWACVWGPLLPFWRTKIHVASVRTRQGNWEPRTKIDWCLMENDPHRFVRLWHDQGAWHS